MKPTLLILPLLWLASFVGAAEKSVRVFVALCDNATQGIIKVPPMIGDGNDLDGNLYWGCDEGLRSLFKRSARWKLINSQRTDKQGTEVVLEELIFKHKTSDCVLTASAYRGSQMSQCLKDFETALRSGEHDLVVFIGHNGLMDGSLELQAAAPKARKVQAMVLCCMSDRYFQGRITSQGAQPLLLTTQLMYPGSFILHDALEPWLAGQGSDAVKTAAAKAYAKNQGLSVKAASGVFSTGRP